MTEPDTPQGGEDTPKIKIKDLKPRKDPKGGYDDPMGGGSPPPDGGGDDPYSYP